MPDDRGCAGGGATGLFVHQGPGDGDGVAGATIEQGTSLLRTSRVDWDDEQIVQEYCRLADIKATFRSFKDELGLRPLHHSLGKRVAGDLSCRVRAVAFGGCGDRAAGSSVGRNGRPALPIEGPSPSTCELEPSPGRPLQASGPAAARQIEFNRILYETPFDTQNSYRKLS